VDVAISVNKSHQDQRCVDPKIIVCILRRLNHNLHSAHTYTHSIHNLISNSMLYWIHLGLPPTPFSPRHPVFQSVPRWLDRAFSISG